MPFSNCPFSFETNLISSNFFLKILLGCYGAEKLAG